MGRMSRGTTLTALTAALVLVLPAGPAAADEPFQGFPQDAVVTLEGDGSGHGAGLSQYGAYSAGRQGVTYREILRTYYPRTRLESLGGRIRVLVSADDDRNLVVDAAPRLRIVTTQPRTRARPTVRGVKKWRVVRRGDTHVISFRKGRWKVWKRVRGDVTFSARGPLTLRTPDGPVAYRGALRSTTHRDERITVNDLPMEQYLRGVVPAEMQAGWPQHALRAQAVAARSYAGFEREAWAFRPYEICDTAACQAYGGADVESRATNKAVRRTARTVLTYDGETAYAQYSASNGGHTVEGPLFASNYLTARPDPWEGESPDYYDWRVTVPVTEIEAFYNLQDLTAIQVSRRDGNGRDRGTLRDGGRVTELLLTTEGGDSPGTYAVDVDRFRANFGLKSTLFEIVSVE